MGKPYYIRAGFPVKGIGEVVPFEDQEQGTSADILNVVPFDSVTGRIRGGRRPGLTKLCQQTINGAHAVQSVIAVNATYVDPVLGSGAAIVQGSTTAATQWSVLSSASGTATAATGSNTFLGATGGPPDNDGNYYFYVVDYTGTTLRLRKMTEAGVQVWSKTMGDSSVAVAAKYLCGICADEDTIYVWYRKWSIFGEAVKRFSQVDGSNKDAAPGSTGFEGAFLRAELGATHTEKVFAGVDQVNPTGAATLWDVLGDAGGTTNSHPCMKVFNGKMAIVGAPVKNGGLANEYELVVYVVDTRSGIVDFVVDFGLDGIAPLGTTDVGMFLDVEFGRDGFIYVLAKDVLTTGTNGFSYLRKISVSGATVWQIKSEANTERWRSIAWNDDRQRLMMCGDHILGTGKSLVEIDQDGKGTTDAVDAGSVTSWNLVRCDGDGNIWLWSEASTITRKFNSTFTQQWTYTWAAGATRASGCCLSAFLNSGTDEAGSNRVQYVYGVANGVVKRLDVEGASAHAIYNPSSLSLASNVDASVIYAATFGVLVFFADGKNLYYLDTSRTNPSTASEIGELREWAKDVRYGRLPQGTAGGFGMVEVWNARVIAFGINDDPANFYCSAKGDPFDWKIRPGVENAAISGRTGPTGPFPEKINAVIPYNSDIAIFGGEKSLYQLSKDPAVDGVFDLISDSVGIAPGRAWCRDGFGSVYFLGNNGGLYKLSLNEAPQEITVKSINKRLESIDLASSICTMAYDVIRQGLWLFVKPENPVEAEQYYLDLKGADGWFPQQFASTDYNPRAVAIVDLDQPRDQKIVLGGEDGYARYLDANARTDDGDAFEAYFVLGPWSPKEDLGAAVMVDKVAVNIGGDGQSRWTLLGGLTAELAIVDGRRLFVDVASSGRAASVSTPMVGEKSIALKVEPEFSGEPQFEGVSMLVHEIKRF